MAGVNLEERAYFDGNDEACAPVFPYPMEQDGGIYEDIYKGDTDNNSLAKPEYTLYSVNYLYPKDTAVPYINNIDNHCFMGAAQGLELQTDPQAVSSVTHPRLGCFPYNSDDNDFWTTALNFETHGTQIQHPLVGPLVTSSAISPQKQVPATGYLCAFCCQTFKRKHDLNRHDRTVHTDTRGLYLCPVPVCTQSRGIGYSRSDKLTEHLWRKHPDLGYTKRGARRLQGWGFDFVVKPERKDGV